MSTYICKCGRRVKKSTNADNTGNRLEGYGPGHECYGCPYVLSWGNYEWNEEAKSLEQKAKGYECRMSKTLAYDSRFIGSTKDKCTCSVFSLDFDFLEQISAWVTKTFPLGEITGNFSRDEIRPTDYSHNGRYCCTFVCTSNKKGIAAKAALFARFFNPDGSRKDMTPQQEMEKILADIEKAKEDPTCETVPNADAAATTAESAVPNAAAATQTTSESAADASESVPAASPQSCESGPAANAESSPAVRPAPSMTATEAAIFDYTQFDEQTAQTLQNYAFRALQAARTYYRDLMEIVVGAHNLLCGPLVPDGDNSRFGNRGEDTFRAWCASVHINKTKAYQLLQIQSFMDTCTPEEQSTLALLPFTAMRELVTGDTPEQVITMAKEGKVGTSKEVLELKAKLKAEKERADAAEKSAQNAHKENAYFKELVKSAEIQTSEDAKRREEAENRYEAALADIHGLTEQNAQLKGQVDAAEAREEEAWKMQSKAEARAKTAEDALKKQPIVGVTDPEEVNRLAHQQAYSIAADMTDEIKKEKDALQKQLKDRDRQLNVMRRQVNDLAQTDFEIANNFSVQLWAAWNSSKGSYSRLVGEDLESTFLAICQAMDGVKEEAARLCRQPVGYDGGADDEPDV